MALRLQSLLRFAGLTRSFHQESEMVSKTQAGTLAVVSIALAASSAALAQYSASDPRSNIYNNESLRRQDEIRRNEEAAKTQQQSDDARSSTNPRPASSSYDPRGAAELRALRKKLLGMPPLPDQRNTLLGAGAS